MLENSDVFTLLFGKNVKAKVLEYMTWVGWVSLEDIQNDCGCSKRSILLIFSEWKERGIVESKRLHGITVYRLKNTVRFSLQGVQNAVFA